MARLKPYVVESHDAEQPSNLLTTFESVLLQFLLARSYKIAVRIYSRSAAKWKRPMQITNKKQLRASVRDSSAQSCLTPPALPQFNTAARVSSPKSADSVAAYRSTPPAHSPGLSTQTGLEHSKKQAKCFKGDVYFGASDANSIGALRLEAQSAHRMQLVQAGFTQVQLDAMAAQHVRGDVFATLVKLVLQLIELGFKQDALAKMKLFYGCQNIWASLTLDTPARLKDKFRLKDINGIASSSCGSQALAALLSLALGLKNLRLNNADIIQVAGTNGGAESLTALIKSYLARTQAEYNLPQTTVGAAEINSARIEQLLAQHMRQLVTFPVIRQEVSFVAKNKEFGFAKMKVWEDHRKGPKPRLANHLLHSPVPLG